MKLKGKIALITGVASGLGKAIAEGFARQGASVAAADLNLSGAKDCLDVDGGLFAGGILKL